MLATCWENDMKSRPILFSGEMVCAILKGKTQTRRPVSFRSHPNYTEPMKQPEWVVAGETCWMDPAHPVRGGHVIRRCPFGKPGDELWVKETWCQQYTDTGYAVFTADGDLDSTCCWYRATTPDVERVDDEGWGTGKSPWSPSIHMPRWASRITLVIDAVRVERLQQISLSDCAAEGAPPTHEDDQVWDSTETFRELWDRFNPKHPWSANDWVWVVMFHRKGD
jgi:hypothetical protein